MTRIGAWAALPLCVLLVGCGEVPGNNPTQGNGDEDMSNKTSGDMGTQGPVDEMATHFVMTWKTDNEGGSDDQSIKIPAGTIASRSYDVDWDNDGVFDELGLTKSVSHDFGAPGTYTIRIRGQFPHMSQLPDGDAKKLIEVKQWGSIQWYSMENMFAGCRNLRITAVDKPDLSYVESTKNMFQQVRYLDIDVSAWDVSNIEDMEGMFAWASEFDSDVSGWNVSKVRNMKSMFAGAVKFNQDLSKWDVSFVEDMSRMFESTETFNGDISTWSVSAVKDMTAMFSNALAFNQDISRWKVKGTRYMQSMFRGAVAFNQDVSGWDVEYTEGMSNIFAGASAFDQDLSSWNPRIVRSMSGMFDDSGLSTKNYDAILKGWSQRGSIKRDLELGAKGVTYCTGEEARTKLMMEYGWTIEDGGKGCM